MPFPFITGKKVLLAPIDYDSIHNYMKWRNDQKIRNQLLLHFPETAMLLENFIESVQDNKSIILLDVYFRRSERHVGLCGFSRINWVHRNAEFHILIGEKEYRNRGIGTEATGLMLKYAFETLNLHKIYLLVFANNKAAIRIYEKNGFQVEGRLEEHFFVEGRYIPALFMSVLACDYKSD